MTTLTMRDLERLPTGNTVTLRDTGGAQTWTRSEHGLTRDGATVALRHFAAAINEGLFSVGEPLRSGWWTRGDFAYYVFDGPVDDEWFVVETRDFAFRNAYWTTELPNEASRPAIYDGAGDHPIEAAYIRNMGMMLYHAQVSYKRHEAERKAFSDALVGWGQSHLEPEGHVGLYDVIRQHVPDFTPPARTVRLRLSIGGSTPAYRPDYDDVDLPDVFDEIDRDGKIDIMWEYEINTDVEYDGVETDACEDRDHFNEEWARRWLADNISGDWDEYSIGIESRGCSDC